MAPSKNDREDGLLIKRNAFKDICEDILKHYVQDSSGKKGSYTLIKRTKDSKKLKKEDVCISLGKLHVYIALFFGRMVEDFCKWSGESSVMGEKNKTVVIRGTDVLHFIQNSAYSSMYNDINGRIKREDHTPIVPHFRDFWRIPWERFLTLKK